jgi:hypothetical protein
MAPVRLSIQQMTIKNISGGGKPRSVRKAKTLPQYMNRLSTKYESADKLQYYKFHFRLRG